MRQYWVCEVCGYVHHGIKKHQKHVRYVKSHRSTLNVNTFTDRQMV